MDIITLTYMDIIPQFVSLAAAIGTGFSLDVRGGMTGLFRLPIMYAVNKHVLKQALVQRQSEIQNKDSTDTRILTSLNSIETVKTSETMEQAIADLTDIMHTQDEYAYSSRREHVTGRQRAAFLETLFEEIMPLIIGVMRYDELQKQKQDVLASAISVLQLYRTLGFKQ